jgi:hypothetical protein
MSTQLTPPIAVDRTGDPDRSTLDPEIAALLDFTPAPRKYKRANSWTGALQRQLIVHLAETGSPARACDKMQKDRYGAEKVYRAEGAEEFRDAWDKAIALFEERDAIRQQEVAAQWAGVRPPGGIDHRAPGPKPRYRPEPAPEEDGYAVSDADKMVMVATLARKFMAKVMAEREARLAGEIVTADFYLRQVTALEVGFDLLADGYELDAWMELASLRRDGHGWLEIAETPLSRALDEMRRDYWRDEGAPEQPEHPPERYCTPFAAAGESAPAYRLEPLQCAFGALSIPAAGYSAEQWAAMDHDAQRAARKAQFAADAAAQAEYERRAFDEWRGRSTGI